MHGAWQARRLVVSAKTRKTSGQLKRKRWGVRTLAFLALAAASVITSSVLTSQGVHSFGLVTFIGLVVGLGGATFCSIRGIRSSAWLTRP
jgi:hypothetical protein